jgi:hypothetical protein
LALSEFVKRQLGENWKAKIVEDNMKSNNYDLALEKFRKILTDPEIKQGVRNIIQNRDVVVSRYQPIFNLENIPNLSEEEFRSFLYFENNRHWSGLYRKGLAVCEDMDLLRASLSILLEPTLPLSERYNKAVTKIKGFGKALATAILLVSSPDKYGVWNNTSERALKHVNLWQEFVRGKTPGQQYEQINRLLLLLASDLGIDLWTLDALMWGVLPEDDEEQVHVTEPVQATKSVTHSFLNEIRHPELRTRLEKLTSAPLDTVMREAGVVFEHHFRNKVDPNSTKHGVDLIADALKPGGKLVFSSHSGEQAGVMYLYQGAMQFIRNPPMHKIIDYPESMAQQFLRLIDALMTLLDHAAMAGELTVDDIRAMLKRRPLKSNHISLFKALYKAGVSGMESRKLAEAMKITPQQLSGVLGALGSRINNTEGLEDKGATLIVFDIRELNNGEWLYIMRPILQKALEEEGLI